MLNKKRIGRLIPYPVIEGGRKVLNAGPRRCVVCGAAIRRFTDTGYGFKVLERLQVVGGMRRMADQCPICHSSCRERLIWFWLTNGGGRFRFPASVRIAHFAPEKGLTYRLKQAAPGGYRAYDFEPARYRHLSGVRQIDLSALKIESDSVDLLVCNHVLEHVPDVELALSEIIRVLAPGGSAILQVPIALKMKDKIELPLDSTAEQRIDLLGQDDHLRLFSEEAYLAVLRSAGLDVTLFDPFEFDDQRATDWMLDPLELLHVCRKPV
ncbi:MAG: class I SAM-dependent methyltransferase [Erythrobacter sp.]|uniref:class I SAM-dependent methyltransferase n=1 Tax=Erythrobacter sp. TaxID=1042 RepID=UPI0032ED1708